MLSIDWVALIVVVSAVSMRWFAVSSDDEEKQTIRAQRKKVVGRISWYPPPVVFAIVWAVLYLLIASALYSLYWNTRHGGSSIVDVSVYNYAWSIVLLNLFLLKFWMPTQVNGNYAAGVVIIVLALFTSIASAALLGTENQWWAMAVYIVLSVWLLFATILDVAFYCVVTKRN